MFFSSSGGLSFLHYYIITYFYHPGWLTMQQKFEWKKSTQPNLSAIFKGMYSSNDLYFIHRVDGPYPENFCY